MRYFAMLLIIVGFNSFALSNDQNRVVEIADDKKKNNSHGLMVNADNSVSVLYVSLDTKVYELSRGYEKLNSNSATKDELRSYHSYLLSFKKDLETVNDVVTDRLNDIFFWGNLLFTVLTILLAVGGFLIVSNNKKVAKESAEEWCSKNLSHERDAFMRELTMLKDMAIDDYQIALNEIYSRKNELDNICDQVRAAMTSESASNDGVGSNQREPNETPLDKGSADDDSKIKQSKKLQTLERFKGLLTD